MQPTILIASTTWWAMPARLALAFSKAGARVTALVPSGSPVDRVRSVQKRFRYSSLRPLAALHHAIEVVQPDLIVPCDDRVVDHLHELYAESIAAGDSTLSSLVVRSLGSPAGYVTTSSRGRLLVLAKELGINIPDTAAVESIEVLSEFARTHPYPLVLKLDGTWGGTGVRVAKTWAEATHAFNEFTKPVSRMLMLQHLSGHDFYPLFARKRTTGAQITVQQFIDGDSANIMLACWEGSVLSSLAVETVYAADHLGSSTIVRTIQNSVMEDVGQHLVSNLMISGFCGLDFIIDAETSKPFLIELNPRATQNGHLEPGSRPSLVSTLTHKLGGTDLPPAKFAEETIAFFPHILRCDKNSVPYVPNLVQDIPWEEPALVQELMRKPWNRRHLTSLAYSAGKRFFGMPNSLASRRGS